MTMQLEKLVLASTENRKVFRRHFTILRVEDIGVELGYIDNRISAQVDNWRAPPSLMG